MKVRVGAQTDVGRARERNEDGYLTQDPLFAVADGMGGHRAGEVASRMALDAMAEVAPDEGPHALPERVKAANRVVFQRASEDRELEGMGTTLTVLYLDGQEAKIAHVGDSRAYLLRDGEFRLLTEDHTLVQRMVREGRLSREEADVHPQRSILTRALGVDDEVDVDDLSVPLRAGDRILMCTDGLTSMIAEERILEVLDAEDDPQAAAETLVEEANRAGGQDNITVVVIDVTDGDASARSAAPAAAASESDRTDVVSSAPASGPEATGVVRTDPARDGDWRGAPAEDGSSRRWPIWVGVAAGVLVLAAVATKLYLDRQWFVGVDEGTVAIFRGVPAEPLGIDLARVVEPTDIPADEAERLAPWRGLSEGIIVDSEEDARDLVEQIRDDVEGQQPRGERPGAEPTPSPAGATP